MSELTTATAPVSAEVSTDDKKSKARTAALAAIAKSKETPAPASIVPAPKVEGETAAAAPATGEKKKSPKSKEALGIPEHMVISWLPFASEPEFNDALGKVARLRNTKVEKVLLEILDRALTDEIKAEIVEEAKKAPQPKVSTSLENKSEEQLATMASKAEKALEEVKNKLAALKAEREKAASKAA